MADESLAALGEKYQSLRSRPGKYGGGEYDEQVDSPDGEKFKVMKALGDQLGLPGTPAADVLARFGKPDELTPSLQPSEATNIPLMPGPVVPEGVSTASAQQQPPYYLVYYWRHKHDYLYFKIDPIKETVITSDWHQTKD